MNQIELKYGCNPNQKPSRVYMENGADLLIFGAGVTANGAGAILSGGPVFR